MESLTATVEKMSAMVLNVLSINGGILFAIIAACIIFLLTRKKTSRDFSFKVRASLTDMMGYSKLLHAEVLGPVTAEQKKLLDEILAGSSSINDIIANIETKNISKPNADISFSLRTALMAINGYNELLRKSHPALSFKQIEALDEIQRASNYILQLLSH